MIERDFRFGSTSAQDGNAVMKASTESRRRRRNSSSSSSSIQEDGFRPDAEVEAEMERWPEMNGWTGCSECIEGGNSSSKRRRRRRRRRNSSSSCAPPKAESNNNLKKRKHPAWIWLVLMQQLMTLLVPVRTGWPATTTVVDTGSKRRMLPVWMLAVLIMLPAGLALARPDISQALGPVKDHGPQSHKALRERGSKFRFSVFFFRFLMIDWSTRFPHWSRDGAGGDGLQSPIGRRP